MNALLPTAGSASPDLVQLVQQTWSEIAARAGIDVMGFDPAASLVDRLAWAQSKGLDIGAVLSRFSSKLQHSTTAQVLDCVSFAANHGIYVPPEFVCVDEGVSGRKSRRDGLERMKAILKHKHARVLLVFKVSRLFRVAYRGFQFFQEEVVEECLRAISVSQGIDTADQKTWKQLAYLHGIMDEMLLTTIADHVRSGIVSLFQRGFVTGALTVGYRPKEIPGAPLTNRGRPRTMPEVEPDVAKLITQHYDWIRDGMPIKEGWRRWVKGGGPCDPRSTSKFMTYSAYRRMLSNPRYTGRWAFGRTRSVWNSKRDYNRHVEQPETEVTFVVSEELRIISDEVFFAVQQRLAESKLGPRGPKKQKDLQLWDLVTDCFRCVPCKVRYYQGGANGHGMKCKNADLCPSLTVVERKGAVLSVCATLSDLIQKDAQLIEQVIGCTQELDRSGDDAAREDLNGMDRKVTALTRKIDDLTELAGEGTDEDRAALKAKIRAAQVERASVQAERARLQQSLETNSVSITPDRVRELLANLTALLEDGAAGRLGSDVIHKAAEVFRKLVGGHIAVHVERRPGRKRTNVYGTFVPRLLRTLQTELRHHRAEVAGDPEAVRVWLRKPPRLDALAERVHQLIDLDGLSYRDAAKVLQSEDHKVNSGNVWYCYRRWYEMHGLPVPKRPYNNGRPRKSA
ncbi:MAG: recombinase family protein [Candidatus Anammoximicrobium sp.]|nr:recombinase family protein [Candidatus Anammoximicrobium sp.]